MTQEQREWFQKKLEEEKTLLEKELGTLGRKNPDDPKDWEATPGSTGEEADPNVQADRLEEYAERSGVEAELENRLLEVNNALQKIQNETYGICEISGDQIEEDRLKANPAARTCKKHLNEKIL